MKKCLFSKNNVLLLTAAGVALMAQASYANDLPTGGQVVAGSGTISQNGTTMTVTQDSASMAANWQSFSIGQGHTVNFVQPSANAVALNRVLGSDVSVIQGALTANGKIFLVNPNGVLFTPDAQVNVGGLVASTLDISPQDFMDGNYTFEGDSTAAVTNQGSIHAPGGTVALVAATIINDGDIDAERGEVLMGAGRKVTLDFGGPVKLEVEEGALETLIEQNGAIRADGGRVYLTAKAASDLSTSVINHTGVTEAKTLATGEKGEIILLGDMDVGTTNVSGTLDATAPDGGDGGFIETSAAHVDIAQGVNITAGSVYGDGGTWLIDPFDYIIDATAAGNIAGTLNTGTNVTVTTTANTAGLGSTGSGTNGNIKVASTIAKTAGGNATLTLRAENVIDLAADITSTAGALNLNLEADSDSNGSGVIIATKGTSLNGGNLNFGTGATATLNGVSTLVGGDVYVGGDDQVVFKTGGGNINLHGELIIANPEGVKFITDNGNARFYGIINGGNKYEKISVNNYSWTQAFNEAKNGTDGEDAVGDQYLATVTSRLENAVVVYTGGFTSTNLADGSWLGGNRVSGTWRWVAGPEGLENGGQGREFNSSASGVTPVNGAFNNWQGGEPNNCCGGEPYLQIGDAFGRWNDLPDSSLPLDIYIRETNYADADLEIDAGTGSVTFDEDIGGLKGINYTAYDATNPNPNRPVTVTTTPQVPQQSAVAAAQSSAGNTPGSYQSSVFYNAPSTPQSYANQGPATVGTMDIVEVSSQSFDQTGGDEGGEDVASAQYGESGNISDYMKVFVVDGGVRLPDGVSEDEEQN